MNQANHTPGPWKTASANGTLCAWRIESEAKPSAQAVAFVAQTIGDNRIEDCNARLIAAAPELLAACESAVAWHLAQDGTEKAWAGSRLAVFETLKRAIAKAEGNL